MYTSNCTVLVHLMFSLQGYKQRNAFIATQGPLKETEQEFWRMLWEQESKVIVMLTKLAERGQVG